MVDTVVAIAPRAATEKHSVSVDVSDDLYIQVSSSRLVVVVIVAVVVVVVVVVAAAVVIVVVEEEDDEKETISASPLSRFFHPCASVR